MKSKNAIILLILGIVLLFIGLLQNSIANDAIYGLIGNRNWDDLRTIVDRYGSEDGFYLHRQILQKHNLSIFLIWVGLFGAGIGGWMLYTANLFFKNGGNYE